MRRIPTALLFTAALFSSVPAAVFAADVMGRGDFAFYLDACAFRGRDGRVVQEIYLRIPNNEIKFKGTESPYTSRVKISVLIARADGTPVIQDAKVMTFSEVDRASTDTSLRFQTIIKRYHLEPGAYVLSCAVENLEAPKVSLMGMMKGQNKIAAVRKFPLEVPEYLDDYASISQSKFLWEVTQSREGAVHHPNPPRMYGLYKDSLEVFVELYLPDSLAQSEDFDFRALVRDREGEVLKESTLRLPKAQEDPSGTVIGGMRTYTVLIREDLTTFLAGSYTIEYSFHLNDRLVGRVRGGSFSVVWDMRIWEIPRRDFLAEARFLLGDAEYETFVELAVGDQERRLDEMWREIDPAPETGVNEGYETFLERLSYINAHYADERTAIFTDRGEIYMRLGTPDEVVIDVIPVNRETMSEAMDLIEDRFHGMDFSTTSVKASAARSTRSQIVDPRGLGRTGEGGNVGYPYELWIYSGTGHPILPRDQALDMQIGHRYLFVDKEGYGRYKLESSSTFSGR